jgi:hypothetical protein
MKNETTIIDFRNYYVIIDDLNGINDPFSKLYQRMNKGEKIKASKPRWPLPKEHKGKKHEQKTTYRTTTR